MKQTTKIGVSGSFVNQVMGNNSSLPVVGAGATLLHYSDRTPLQVLEISKDGKRVKVEEYNAVADKTKQNAMGHQNWVLVPSGHTYDLVWRSGKWRREYFEVCFTKETIEQYTNEHGSFNLPEEVRIPIFGDDCVLKEVEGVTMKVKKYDPVSVLFGTMEYYYDWSF